jgi:uncharacterized membrane protein
MEGIAVVLLVVVFLFAGAVCGCLALIRIVNLRREIESLRADLIRLRLDLRRAAPAAPPAPAPFATEPFKPAEAPPPVEIAAPPPPPRVPVSPKEAEPRVPRPPAAEWIAAPAVPPVDRKKPPFGFEWPSSLPSFEMMMGTKALVWLGMVMLLVGTGFFLKYAYDNQWIGPRGRLVIGVLCGCAALAIGERFRRRDWRVLFQTLTGGGIGAFYLCIFFSFQVYKLSGAGVSMGLAVLVTGFAIAMAVGHDAVEIAILALIGGFLSPVLLTTGENHPYGLFTYIAILDLVAIGAAYFRRWRAVDLLCFAGTCILYQGWYQTFYAANQIQPALIYISLFYVIFLVVPTLYGIVRRIAEEYEGLILLAANALFSFYCYYAVLFHQHRQALGFVVIAQALLVFLLFCSWAARVGARAYTAESLLVISLALVTIAVPIQLKLYGVPIAWAMEGVVFTYLGIRFQRVLCRVAGLAALALAVGGLLHRLPLHTATFNPVFNVPFGSWVVVIAAVLVTTFLLQRRREYDVPGAEYVAGGVFLAALALIGVLLSLETAAYWQVSRVADRFTHEFSSLTVLWALIALGAAEAIRRLGAARWMALAWVACGIGALMFFAGLEHYRVSSSWLALNVTFPPKFFFVAVLWWISRRSASAEAGYSPTVLELAGHGLFALLAAFELDRWGDHTAWITPRMAFSLTSAVWALQAFGLIWFGLRTQGQARRIAGFVLFGIAVAKVLVLDTSQLEKVYRIVSWLASGALLLAAGYFYHRYIPMLTGQARREDKP